MNEIAAEARGMIGIAEEWEIRHVNADPI